MWMLRRPLPVVLILALAVRLALLWAASGVGTQIADERHYVQLATSLADGDGFGFGPGTLTSMRPPLYPAFIATVWAVTGSRTLAAVRATQIAIGLGSILLLYTIVRRLFDQRTAVAAAAIFGLYPSLLFSGVLILSETLFIAFFLIAIFGCLILLDRHSLPWAFGTGVVLALAALTRSIMWPSVVVLIPFLWLTARTSRRQRTMACALLLAGFVLTLAPWAIRNTRLQKTFVLVDAMGGINLLTGNYQFTPEDRMWDGVSLTGAESWSAPLSSRPDALHWTEGQKEKWARTAAAEFMTAHPLLTAKRSILKLADLWGLEREWVAGLQRGLYRPPDWFALVSSMLVIGVYPIVLLLGIVGICCVRPNDARAHRLFLLLIVFTSALHGLTFGHSRYHLPLIPLIALYAAAAVVHRAAVIDQLRVRRHALVPALVAAACVTVWVHEVVFRDADRVNSLLVILRQAL
jgi:4-amino-4-deoxy-L-arabinose transferase-like glycosyltransferase